MDHLSQGSLASKEASEVASVCSAASRGHVCLRRRDTLVLQKFTMGAVVNGGARWQAPVGPRRSVLTGGFTNRLCKNKGQDEAAP